MNGPADVLRQMRVQVDAIQQEIRQLHPLRVFERMNLVHSFDSMLQQKMQREPAFVSGEGAKWAPMIEKHAAQFGVDPVLVRAVMQVESSALPHSLSPKGAAGLMQLMPQTAVEMGVSDPFDPDQNIRGGTQYLRLMLDRFGDLSQVLAAYNAGPQAVEQYGGIPPFPETQDYVRRVLAEVQRLRLSG